MSSFDEKARFGVSDPKPGWPLLQTAGSKARPSKDARKISVVKWVMTSLPRRSLSLPAYPEFDTSACTNEGVFRREYSELLLDKCNSIGCRVFDYNVIKCSTSNFSSANLIGKGGCNSVYKGVLPEGRPVAVKVLKSSKESLKNFMLELDIITSINHKRITPLLGICVKDNELISVYEFLSKGSLEQNLHGDGKERSILSWDSRFGIAFGIAEALHYLHNECSKPIIHRDVKSSNILLTEELEPQLCDFGLAMWGPTSPFLLMDSDLVGTFGYLAPEYFMYGKISDKIDVYSFGVVLLELISGRKAIGLETTKAKESLVMWAKPKLESGELNLKSILDPCLGGKYDETQLQRMALAAKLCLNPAARIRPGIEKILCILKGEEYEDGAKLANDDDDDDDDDEVYPDSHAESHLSLALLDVNDNSTSFSSVDQSSPLCVEEYLKKRCSRSSSLE
ncbi:Protein kinase superfamily protein [Striga hermonthica]|uniref:Protein kinase superfamily protein n=1 Tax=Striga hermonthica TaxID=68872 RepID=A0A9N7NEY4_STRHE|nr:Protein kinase superfamily protein [Striga hermonthica]